MNKILSMAAIVLMFAGSTSFAGEQCTGEKKAACTAEKKAACSAEKSGCCAEKSGCTAEKSGCTAEKKAECTKDQ